MHNKKGHAHNHERHRRKDFRRQRHGRGKCGVKAPSSREKELSQKVVEDFQKRQKADPRSVKTSFTFETHVHIISNSEGVGDVSDEVIELNMGLLNEGFSGILESQGTDCNGDSVSGRETNIRFTLASINRVTNDKWFTVDFEDEDTQEEMGMALRVGGCDVMNVYVYGHDDMSYASYPMGCSRFKNWDAMWLAYWELLGHEDSWLDDVGDTFIHEAGHWAGLYHVFDGGGCEETDGGDLVEDTPPQLENSGCPANRDTCLGGGLDSIHNYMDYTDYCCVNEFSEGQITRMHAMLERFRSGEETTDDYYDCKTSKLKFLYDP